MAGRFITFEGGEGSGKSTQARRLAARLQAAGISTVLTREPGGSPFAERVRQLLLDPSVPAHPPLAEALMFYAARADHLNVTIRPALAAGHWVICDRFADSTRVYQGTAGNVEPAVFDTLERLVIEPTMPNLTLIIDLDAGEGMQRAAARGAAARGDGTHGAAAGGQQRADRYEAREAAFHQALRGGFLELARREPRRCVLIDGRGSEDDVATRVWQAARERLAIEGGT